MWNDPGSPWHTQTGLYCPFTDFSIGWGVVLGGGAERDRERMDIMWEKEKCFAGQLRKKCLIHGFPFNGNGWLSAWGGSAVRGTVFGQQRALWAVWTGRKALLEAYIQQANIRRTSRHDAARSDECATLMWAGTSGRAQLSKHAADHKKSIWKWATFRQDTKRLVFLYRQ